MGFDDVKHAHTVSPITSVMLDLFPRTVSTASRRLRS